MNYRRPVQEYKNNTNIAPLFNAECMSMNVCCVLLCSVCGGLPSQPNQGERFANVTKNKNIQLRFKPDYFKSIIIRLGPDFFSDEIEVETSDHARLSLRLLYSWKFDIVIEFVTFKFCC